MNRRFSHHDQRPVGGRTTRLNNRPKGPFPGPSAALRDVTDPSFRDHPTAQHSRRIH